MFPHVFESNTLGGDSGGSAAAPPDGAQSIGPTESGRSTVVPQESRHPSGDQNVRNHELTGYLYTTNRSDHVSARFEPIRGSAQVETLDH